MIDIAPVLALLDKHTPARVLDRVGLSPERVRALLPTPLTREAAQRAAARATLATVPKGRWKGARLPGYVVRAMYADYLRLRSTHKAGALYGRSGTAVQAIFRRAGLALIPRQEHPSLVYRDVTYHCTDGRYYRNNAGGHVTFLHKRIWEDARGPIPAGHQVAFRDGDHANLAPANLVCLPKAAVTSLHRRRVLAMKTAP